MEIENNFSSHLNILEFLKKNPDGVNKDVLMASVNINEKHGAEILNELISENRVYITELRGEQLFKYRSEKEASKFRDLTFEEIQAFEIIIQTGSMGISTNDLKYKLNINANSFLNKILKRLEKKLLIKSLKMINMKNKKVKLKENQIK
jgi:predicted transcriptional regulator